MQRKVISGGPDCINNQDTFKTEACNEHVCPHTFAISSIGWICFVLIILCVFLAGVCLNKKGLVKKPELPLITFGEVARSSA